MTIPSILCQMRLPKTLRTYLNEARSAFAYAPIEVVLGVLLAVTFSIAVRQRGGDEWWAYVGVGVVLALPLVFGLSVLRARRAVAATLSWVASAIVLASVAAYAAWIFDPDLEAEMWRAASLTAAAVLTISLVPVVGRGERERVRRRVWAFAIELLLRVAGVLIYAGLLFAALAGAVAAGSRL
jgi:membrane protein YdbS with pleckstrin-like domain